MASPMPASKMEIAFGKRFSYSSTNSSARARAVFWRLTLKIALRSSATSIIAEAGTWAKTLRWKCTTHRCHWAPGNSPATAALMPSWSSETTRRTPRSPRSSSPRSKEVYATPFSEPATSTANKYLSKALLIHPNTRQQRHARDARPPAHLQVRGIQVEVRVGLPLQRATSPFFLLRFKASSDATHCVLADPHLAQCVGDPGNLTHRDPREIHLEHRLLDVSGHPLVTLEELGDELTLPVARHLQAFDLTRRGQEVALVVAVTLTSPGGGELPVTGLQMLGHLLLEDLFEDGLHALAEPGLHVQHHVMLELVLL